MLLFFYLIVNNSGLILTAPVHIRIYLNNLETGILSG